jgi:nucleoside-diphosphate-sugar epimerase
LAKKMLGFTPKTNIEKGIAKYVRWYIKEGAA